MFYKIPFKTSHLPVRMAMNSISERIVWYSILKAEGIYWGWWKRQLYQYIYIYIYIYKKCVYAYLWKFLKSFLYWCRIIVIEKKYSYVLMNQNIITSDMWQEWQLLSCNTYVRSEVYKQISQPWVLHFNILYDIVHRYRKKDQWLWHGSLGAISECKYI